MSELLDLAEMVVSLASDREQLEVVVVHERETEARAYEGEVESLTVAESRGVGVRVVSGNRQGFAYTGTFDEDAVGEALAEARDNMSFATPDEHCGVAEPDGVDPVDLDLYRGSLCDHPTDAKVAMALELQR
ncbi:MAG: DNA gyrase modulator [Acidimicrobiales bacterium]|nr:DNA gyrase modulator [Acidimicrobiales bacterium]